MSDDLKDTFERSVASYDAAILQKQSEYQAARSVGDKDGQSVASMEIATLSHGKENYVRQMHQYVQSQQPRPPAPMPGEDQLSRGDVALCRKYGLAPDNLAVAKNWTSDSKMSDDDKVKTYLDNQKRYRQARADGSYRDDQGTVRR